MLVSTVIAALAAVAAGAPHNKHVADFRIFGAPGCHAENMGVWTVISGDFANDQCKSLNDDTVRSVTLVDINKPCKMHVYTDAACKQGRKEVGKGQCVSNSGTFKAWSMKC